MWGRRPALGERCSSSGAVCSGYRLTSAAAWAIAACTDANGADDTSFDASLIAEESE